MTAAQRAFLEAALPHVEPGVPLPMTATPPDVVRSKRRDDGRHEVTLPSGQWAIRSVDGGVSFVVDGPVVVAWWTGGAEMIARRQP